jgi:hypothetical protein
MMVGWGGRRLGRGGMVAGVALFMAACSQAYDPPQVYDEIFANGATTEVASDGFGGLRDIVQIDDATGVHGLPARVLWTHGMCTPAEAPSAAWWQFRTNDLLAAYPGAALVQDSVKIEALPQGAVLIKEGLRPPGPSAPSRTIELWFLDWSPLTAPYKPTGMHDPENPADNPYRYTRATLNRELKQGLIKDCFADVVMYLGRSGDPIRSDTQFALCEFFGGRLDSATGCAGASAGSATMLISESLGSSILFDGFRSLKFDYMRRPEPSAAHSITPSAKPSRALRAQEKIRMARLSEAVAQARTNSEGMTSAMTSLTNFFMLANQIPLIGLADARLPGEMKRNRSLEEFIASATEMRLATAKPLTIVAFGDPNDLLSFRLIPKSARARIVNFVVSNDDTYVGYAERPDKAHCNYVRNGYVMHAIVFGYAGGKPERGAVDEPESCLQDAPGVNAAGARQN